jgi:hypothetical protein
VPHAAYCLEGPGWRNMAQRSLFPHLLQDHWECHDWTATPADDSIDFCRGRISFRSTHPTTSLTVACNLSQTMWHEQSPPCAS